MSRPRRAFYLVTQHPRREVGQCATLDEALDEASWIIDDPRDDIEAIAIWETWPGHERICRFVARKGATTGQTAG